MKEESQEITWNWSEWEGMLEEVFKMVATTLPTDLTLVTEDGEMLEAHSIILKASSPFFRSILDKSRPVGNKNIIIYMPGFSHQHLVLVVEFVYSGRTTVLGGGNLLHQFVATANRLGMLLTRSKPTYDSASAPAGTWEKTSKEKIVEETNETEGQQIFKGGENPENVIADKMSERTENKKSIDNTLRIEKSTGDVGSNIDVNELFEITKHVTSNPINQIEFELEKGGDYG